MTLTTTDRTEADYGEQTECLAKAQAALRCLPDTHDAIARHLHELGCRGHVGDGQPTALEMYLRKATGWDCDVARESVEWGTSSWSFTLKLSSVVSRFGWCYDAGDYEELYGYPTAGSTTEISADELPGLAPMGR